MTATSDGAKTPALELQGIHKTFDGFKALENATFVAQRGEIHALLGENGAGKSTLMNVACGLYAPDTGRVAVDGAVVRLSGPRAAAAIGIGMVHQHFKLVRPFSVAENVLLANEARFGAHGYGRGLELAAEAVVAVSSRLGAPLDPARRIEHLSVAEQQRVEVVKILIGGARTLILDEPTAVLTDLEAERLLTTLSDLADAGSTIVLVTHKLADVRRFANRVTIMRGGRTVATVDPRATDTAELTRLTVGETMPAASPRGEGGGRPLIEARNLCCLRRDGVIAVHEASFEVRAGEIYGIAGVSGNGQSELAEALMGMHAPVSGEIRLGGRGEALRTAAPDRMRRLGCAFIPADRYKLAIAGGLPVIDNFAIGGVNRGRYGHWAWLNPRRMRAEAAAAVAEYDVQGVRSLDQRAALLSGGNAQKLVIAREFAGDPDLIVVQSPSRGLDARATAAVHGRLSEARARGAAILLLSEDLDEVMALSDRIGVMSRGRIVGEFAAPADRQAIGRAMVGHD